MLIVPNYQHSPLRILISLEKERLPERLLITKRRRNLCWTTQKIAHTKEISQTQGTGQKCNMIISRFPQYGNMIVTRRLV